MSVAVFSLVTSKGYPDIPENFYLFVLNLVNEFLIGVTIGLFVNIIFSAFQLAAQFFSFQMGLGISEVLDPLSEIQSPVIGQLYNLYATLIFIAMNGLSHLVTIIYRSFDLVGWISISSRLDNLFVHIKTLFAEYFMIALQIAIPLMVTLLLVNVVLGIISKFAPRINVFSIGLDIDVLVGFLLLIMYLPFLTSLTQKIFSNLLENIMQWINIIA